MLPEKATRGVLMKMLRDQANAPDDTICPFGRFKGWAYRQIPPDYLDWCVDETARSSSPSEDLVRLNKNKKSTKAQQRGLPEEDPEKQASAKPPETKRSTPGSSKGWERVRTPSSSPSPRHRHPHSTPATKEELQKELKALEERMATLKQSMVTATRLRT